MSLISFLILVLCNESKECEVKFSLSIRNKPLEDEKSYFEVSVVKSGIHKHEVGKKQLRGNTSKICHKNLLSTQHFNFR